MYMYSDTKIQTQNENMDTLESHNCDRIWENPPYGIFFRKLTLMHG